MRQPKYYNNKKVLNPVVRNRRDADKLISASFSAFLLLGCMALRDEFDFGKKRVERFIKRYNLKTACLMDPEISGLTWKDLNQYLKEELGLDLRINGEI